MINSSVLKATRLAMPAMAAAAGYSYGESAGRADDGLKGDGAVAFQRSTKLGASYALCEKGTVLDVLKEIKRKVSQPVANLRRRYAKRQANRRQTLPSHVTFLKLPIFFSDN